MATYKQRTRGTRDGATSLTLDLTAGTGAQVGDLVVLMLGTRQAATQLTTDGRELGYVGIPPAGDGSSPAVYCAWWQLDQDLIDNPPTLGFDRSVQASYELAGYDGDTIDWADPVAARCFQEGATSAPNPRWITYIQAWGSLGSSEYKGEDWTSNHAADRVAATGRVAMFHRANSAAGSIGMINGASAKDEGGNLAGSGDSSGLRARYGGSAAVGGGSTLGSAFECQACSIPTATFASVISYAVQQLYYPRVDPYGGPAFSYTQEEDSRRILFANHLTERHPDEAYAWTFGDGTTGDRRNPAHSYAAAGTYTVTVEMTNPAGTSGQLSLDVDVLPIAPTAKWIWTQGQGTTGELLDLSTQATSWLWEIWHGTDTSGAPDATYTTPNATHTFPSTGSYAVRLTATGLGGTDQLERTIVVKPPRAPLPARADGLLVSLGVAYEGEWHDVTCDALDLDWAWGTDDDLGVFSVPAAGRLIARIKDPDRVWDPENTASPLAGLWDVGSLLRLRLGSSAGMHTFWTGYVVDLDHDLFLATIQGDDGVARLAAVDVDLDGPQALPAQTAGERVNALLTLAGWPSSLRDVQLAGSALQGAVVSEQTIWRSLMDVQEADLGRLMITQDGIVTWRARGTAWADDEIKLELGCQLGAAAGLQSVRLAGATRAMVNMLRAGIQGGDANTYIRQESVDRFGRFTGVRTDLLLTTSAALDTWATHVLDRHDKPSYQARQLRFLLDQGNVAQLAGLRMGDLVRAYDDTHPGAPIDVTARLLGIRYVATPWTVSATMTTTTDHPLVAGDRQARIDTDVELAAWARSDQAKITGTGADAVLELDRA